MNKHSSNNYMTRAKLFFRIAFALVISCGLLLGMSSLAYANEGSAGGSSDQSVVQDKSEGCDVPSASDIVPDPDTPAVLTSSTSVSGVSDDSDDSDNSDNLDNPDDPDNPDNLDESATGLLSVEPEGSPAGSQETASIDKATTDVNSSDDAITASSTDEGDACDDPEGNDQAGGESGEMSGASRVILGASLRSPMSLDETVQDNEDDNSSSDQNTEKKTVSIAILSDTHYVSDAQRKGHEENINKTATTEIRMLDEIDGIITVALDQVSQSDPDVMLVCGDLTSNGELSGAQALADKLNTFKNNNEGTGIYVVNGNHDINNSYAADYTGSPDDPLGAATRISPDDFKNVYNGLGYGENDHCAGGSREEYNPEGDDPTKAQNHGGLSYVTDIADGVSLIVMDTGIYSYQDLVNSRYSEAQQTPGYVSEGLLEWVVEKAKALKEKGNLVLAMCHHSLMPHYSEHNDTMDYYMESFVISNYKEVSNALADAGITAVLTGHSHANDIAKYVSPNGNVLYDIQTAALCAYPVAWRTVNIGITGSGADAVYDFSIDTHFIDKDFAGVEGTGSWTVVSGGQEKSFINDFDGSMQDYSYEKSGIRQEVITPVIDYLLKPTLYEIAENDTGLAGYIQDKLKIETGTDIGTYVTDKLIDFFDENREVKDYKPIEKASLTISASKEDVPDRKTVKYNLIIKSDASEENASVSLDLNGLTTSINSMIVQLNDLIREGDWTGSNYKASALQKEINKLLSGALISALSKPIENGVTGFKIINDAFQAFAKGDEGVVPTAQRQQWNQLLNGKQFSDTIKSSIADEIKKVAADDSEYERIHGVLNTELVPQGKRSVLSIEGNGTYASLARAFLGDTLNNANVIISKLSYILSDLIPESATNLIAKPLSEIQESMTQDAIIPDDSIWNFHSVLFYPNYEGAAAINSLTVEEHRTGYYPVLYRDGYTFDGWFTDAVYGDPVAADADFSGIYRLYAHWTQNDPPQPGPEPQPVPADIPDGPSQAGADGDNDGGSTYNNNGDAEDLDYLTKLTLYLGAIALGTNESMLGDKELVNAADLLAQLPTGAHIEGKRILDKDGNEIPLGVFITDSGLLGINIKKYSSLPSMLIRYIRLLRRDLAIYYRYEDRWYVIIVPANAEMPVDRSGELSISSLIEKGFPSVCVYDL